MDYLKNGDFVRFNQKARRRRKFKFHLDKYLVLRVPIYYYGKIDPLDEVTLLDPESGSTIDVKIRDLVRLNPNC